MWVARTSDKVYILMSNGTLRYMQKGCYESTGCSFHESNISEAHLTAGADGRLYLAYLRKYSDNLQYAVYDPNSYCWCNIGPDQYSNGVCTSWDQIAEDILLR